jgi:hypothetical protein
LSNLLNSQSCFHTTSIEPGVDSRSRGWICSLPLHCWYRKRLAHTLICPRLFLAFLRSPRDVKSCVAGDVTFGDAVSCDDARGAR